MSEKLPFVLGVILILIGIAGVCRAPTAARATAPKPAETLAPPGYEIVTDGETFRWRQRDPVIFTSADYGSQADAIIGAWRFWTYENSAVEQEAARVREAQRKAKDEFFRTAPPLAQTPPQYAPPNR